MADVDETFFTIVGCMDGRVQEPVAKFGREKFGAEYPDTITEAGLVGQLAKDVVDEALLTSIRFKLVDVSIGKHNSIGVLVHGHQECAGNPVTEEKHMEDVRKSSAIIQDMVGPYVPVVGVFVSRAGENWKVEEV